MRNWCIFTSHTKVESNGTTKHNIYKAQRWMVESPSGQRRIFEQERGGQWPDSASKKTKGSQWPYQGQIGKGGKQRVHHRWQREHLGAIKVRPRKLKTVWFAGQRPKDLTRGAEQRHKTRPQGFDVVLWRSSKISLAGLEKDVENRILYWSILHKTTYETT